MGIYYDLLLEKNCDLFFGKRAILGFFRKVVSQMIEFKDSG